MAITKDIRPSTAYTICDVCGRTLLRGERAEIYIDGGARRSVCELCKPRALNEGWLREGTVRTYDENDASSNRRGSFLSRLRRRREATPEPPELLEADYEPPPEPRQAPAPVPAEPRRVQRRREREPNREPRHVRAVPMGAEQKIASAVEVFNNSEHRRTVAGVARSLGAPTVSIHPNMGHSSLVHIVASWELCWYRYEVDLSDEVPVVRVAAQGYELDELTPEERQPNASYDEHGALGPA
ncbi:MAG TPA: hypothetical protein VMG37_24010 [Solirubrobacteraceae bacterium]|nr:hypothetical protein [Solirubrobacteraceae bacterium]